MNKKGFTLIELLGVLVIIGLISAMVIPRVTKMVNGEKDKLYQRQLEGIVESGKVWASKHLSDLPEAGEVIEITLGELKRDGDADKDLKNPKTNKKFNDDNVKVRITNDNGNLKYEVIVE